MAEKDLIPWGPKGDPRSDELRSRQKGSKSEKRREGAKRRWQLERFKNMSAEEFEKKGLEILSDPKRFDMEMMFLIQELIKNPNLNEKIKLDLISKMTQVKAAVWGTVSKSLNVNINKSMSGKMQETWEICQKENGTNRKPNNREGNKDKEC